MKRKDPTILIALVIALGVHAAILGAGIQRAHEDLGWWLKLGPPVAKMTRPALTLPQTPPPKIEEMVNGEHDGKGKSINRADGSVPMQSTIADENWEQAVMSRDPTGFKSQGQRTAAAQVIQGEVGNRPALAPRQDTDESAVAPRPAKLQIDPLARGPNAPAPATPPSLPQPKATPGKQTDATHQQNNNAPPDPKTGAPAAGGTPLPQGDFESSPQTTIASVMVAGRIEARTGRKLITRQQPDIDLAGWADLASMDAPRVVLRLNIDEAGNVTDVRTTRSSGSDNVNLSCERAAATWWFEPRKDPKTSKPTTDVIDFTIFFR